MLKYTALFEVTYPNRVAVLIRREAIACCWSAGRAHLAPGHNYLWNDSTTSQLPTRRRAKQTTSKPLPIPT